MTDARHRYGRSRPVFRLDSLDRAGQLDYPPECYLQTPKSVADRQEPISFAFSFQSVVVRQPDLTTVKMGNVKMGNSPNKHAFALK